MTWGVNIKFKLFWSSSGKTQALNEIIDDYLLQNCSAVLETSLLCIRKPKHTQFVHRILEGCCPGS
jgi:hypothetical protein